MVRRRSVASPHKAARAPGRCSACAAAAGRPPAGDAAWTVEFPRVDDLLPHAWAAAPHPALAPGRPSAQGIGRRRQPAPDLPPLVPPHEPGLRDGPDARRPPSHLRAGIGPAAKRCPVDQVNGGHRGRAGRSSGTARAAVIAALSADPNAPSISVLVPAYNAARTLPATVASIEAQSV